MVAGSGADRTHRALMPPLIAYRKMRKRLSQVPVLRTVAAPACRCSCSRCPPGTRRSSKTFGLLEPGYPSGNCRTSNRRPLPVAIPIPVLCRDCMLARGLRDIPAANSLEPLGKEPRLHIGSPMQGSPASRLPSGPHPNPARAPLRAHPSVFPRAVGPPPAQTRSATARRGRRPRASYGSRRRADPAPRSPPAKSSSPGYPLVRIGSRNSTLRRSSMHAPSVSGRRSSLPSRTTRCDRRVPGLRPQEVDEERRVRHLHCRCGPKIDDSGRPDHDGVGVHERRGEIADVGVRRVGRFDLDHPCDQAVDEVVDHRLLGAAVHGDVGESTTPPRSSRNRSSSRDTPP